MPTVDIQLVFVNLSANNPVVVRLSDGDFTIPSDGITLDPAPTPGSATTPASIAGLILGKDTVTVTAGDTANFTLTVGVTVDPGTKSLQGQVTIGAGATVTISQVGNRESDEIQNSKLFSISLKGIPDKK